MVLCFVRKKQALTNVHKRLCYRCRSDPPIVTLIFLLAGLD
jgi:hypothetical protein